MTAHSNSRDDGIAEHNERHHVLQETQNDEGPREKDRQTRTGVNNVDEKLREPGEILMVKTEETGQECPLGRSVGQAQATAYHTTSCQQALQNTNQTVNHSCGQFHDPALLSWYQCTILAAALF